MRKIVSLIATYLLMAGLAWATSGAWAPNHYVWLPPLGSVGEANFITGLTQVDSTLASHESSITTIEGNITTIQARLVQLTNVENTALSTWAGTSNISTLGTITSGIWHGTAIQDAYVSSAATWNGKIDKSIGTAKGSVIGFSDASTPVEVAKSGNNGYVLTEDSTQAAGFSFQSTTLGKVVQSVYTETGAVNTGSTILPGDNTIPQNTEGNEYMTQTITPVSATNLLRIEVTAHLARSDGGGLLTAALFQDTTAGALAAGSVYAPAANAMICVKYTHWMVAGTTSATTFKVRGGAGGAATVTFNGQAGVGLFGGVLTSSIIITEYSP